MKSIIILLILLLWFATTIVLSISVIGLYVIMGTDWMYYGELLLNKL